MKGFNKRSISIDGTLEGEKALLGGPEYGFRKILANGAGPEKLKTLESNPIIHGFFGL